MIDCAELVARSDAVTSALRDGLLNGAPLQLVKAPPGAGKTYLLLQLLEAGHTARMRLAVATFTNAQADDICRRLADQYPSVPVVRFISSSALEPTLPTRVQIVRKTEDLPHGPCVVVATTAKWAFTPLGPTAKAAVFDALLVDEAWQIAWADFLLLRGVAGRFVLIGDPGQIPPVVSVSTDRWETSPNAPHIPTPQLLLSNSALDTTLLELPGSRRLPSDAVSLVNAFYDFEFGAFAQPGERFVRFGESGAGSPLDRGLDLLADSSVVGLTVPTPDDGPPAEVDDELAKEVSKIVARLLDRDPTASHSDETVRAPIAVCPDDIGIVSTHRTMNTRLQHRLPAGVRSHIRVDTPERWQGLECKVMVAVHPLSGVTSPTSFELETGRLCVMASRHRSSLLLVTRDHVADTLRGHIVGAEQPVGRADLAGVGHHRHTNFWNELTTEDQVVAL